MKTASLFLAASMAVAVAAKGLTDVLPACAVDCVANALKTTKCSLEDAACLCADQDTYQSLLGPAVDCMVKACGETQTITKISPDVVHFCAVTNPKLTSRPAAPSTSAPAAPKTTPAQSSKAPSAAASPASSETSPEASETSDLEKKWTSDQSSEISEATASASAIVTASKKASSTTTTTVTASSSTGAAGAAGPMVTAAMLVAGAVAML
ncbi:cell wall protein [Trichoderma aethiopicum]